MLDSEGARSFAAWCPTVTGEVNGTDVAVAKHVQCSPGQVLHLCGKRREYSEAENVRRTLWLWQHNVGLKLKMTLLVEGLLLEFSGKEGCRRGGTLF